MENCSQTIRKYYGSTNRGTAIKVDWSLKEYQKLEEIRSRPPRQEQRHPERIKNALKLNMNKLLNLYPLLWRLRWEEGFSCSQIGSLIPISYDLISLVSSLEDLS